VAIYRLQNPAQAARIPLFKGDPHSFARIRRHEQGPEKTRVLICRNGHLLFLDAGDRDGG